MPLALDPSAPSWARSLINQLDQVLLRITGRSDRPFRLPTFVVANLPDAAQWGGCLITVSDETDGPTVAFSDFSDWRRVQDRSVVS